jgi:hypothetical protein
MKEHLKHLGLFVGGAGCIVASVFFPPVAPVLGPIGTKLVIAGAGVSALTLVSPDTIKAVAGVFGKKTP